jgi:predicted amidohydrolase
MKIGIYQNHPEFGNIQSNVTKTLDLLRYSACDLMVLPELFNTGYQFTSREEALSLAEETPSGYTCSNLAALAKKTKMFLVFGLVEKDGEKVYNSSVLVGPDGFIDRYRKSHLFFEEKEVFDPGDTGFKVYDINGVRIGMMICFDWWFPESTRTLALLGADIICHPANLVLLQCQQAMITRSLENAVFTMTANRIGQEARGGKKPLSFTGQSQIVDPQGQVLIRMDEHEIGVQVVEIDPLQARDKRITAYNDRFQDRRPELYDQLCKPFPVLD